MAWNQVTRDAHCQLSPPLEFSPLRLSADDLLPVDILMLLVYRDRPRTLVQGLQAALRAFPHLTGRLTNDAAAGMPPVIVPDKDGTLRLEVMESDEILEIDDFRRFSLEEHLGRFAPEVPAEQPGAWWRCRPLFAARRVDFPRSGFYTLCLRISHMAIDGVGLKLFASHVNAVPRGGAAPVVVHDRSCRLNNAFPVDVGRVPEGYIGCPFNQAPGWVNPDVLAAADPCWFSVPLAAACDAFGGLRQPIALRNRFAAWLACEVRRIDAGFQRSAVWCNPRGRNGVPVGFTGNSGCYQHMEIAADDARLAENIRWLGTRGGLATIRATYQTITAQREAGREIWWDGPHDDLLQLNLLTPPRKVADFGGGPPLLTLLLTRNSSGLRITPTVCGGFILVEATLPEGVADELVVRCRKRGLAPMLWGRRTA